MNGFRLLLIVFFFFFARVVQAVNFEKDHNEEGSNHENMLLFVDQVSPIL